jgi:hypothetical protein
MAAEGFPSEYVGLMFSRDAVYSIGQFNRIFVTTSSTVQVSQTVTPSQW